MNPLLLLIATLLGSVCLLESLILDRRPSSVILLSLYSSIPPKLTFLDICFYREDTPSISPKTIMRLRRVLALLMLRVMSALGWKPKRWGGSSDGMACILST